MRNILLALLLLIPSLVFGGQKNLSLQWDNNTEVDLAGYKVFFIDDATGQELLNLDVPYRSTDTHPVVVDRILDVPDGAVFTLGVEKIAYDDARNESDRCERITVDIDMRDTTPPAVPDPGTITVTDVP